MLTFEEYQYRESLLGDLKTRLMGKGKGGANVDPGYKEVLAAVVQDLPINTLNASEAQAAANAAWNLISDEMAGGKTPDVRELALKATRAAIQACGFKVNKFMIEPNLRMAIGRIMETRSDAASEPTKAQYGRPTTMKKQMA